MGRLLHRGYTLNNKGPSKRTFQYYYHATPGEPLQEYDIYSGILGFCWNMIVTKFHENRLTIEREINEKHAILVDHF